MKERVPLVVALVGSPRQGNTLFLIDTVLDILRREGLQCERVVLSEHTIRPCEGHEDCRQLAACPLTDDAGDILARVFAADYLVLGSPVYFENVSGQMKILMDRTCWHYEHGFRLRAQSAVLIAVGQSSGLHETLDAMRRYLDLVGQVPCLEAAGFAHRANDARMDRMLVDDVRRIADRLLARPPG